MGFKGSGRTGVVDRWLFKRPGMALDVEAAYRVSGEEDVRFSFWVAL